MSHGLKLNVTFFQIDVTLQGVLKPRYFFYMLKQYYFGVTMQILNDIQNSTESIKFYQFSKTFACIFFVLKIVCKLKKINPLVHGINGNSYFVNLCQLIPTCHTGINKCKTFWVRCASHILPPPPLIKPSSYASISDI